MTSFDELLRSFQQALISYQELLSGASLLAVSSPEEIQQIKCLLQAEYTSGRITLDVYQGLESALENKTKLFTGEIEVTRLSSPGLNNDKTIVSQGEGRPWDSGIDKSSPLNTESLLKGLNPNRAIAALTVGDTVKNRFVLEELLGSGGMGKVFKAKDLRKVEAGDKDASVALKVLSEDFKFNPMALVALQRETKRTQILSHPNIIKVYDFDRDGDHVFMTMEYLEGRPLSDLINDHKDIGYPFEKSWPIIRAIAEALAFAHKKNIVHSDLKPSNVYVCRDDEVRVLDFGIACAIGRSEKGGEDATLFNARSLGALTLAYASLEQYRNCDPDPRDDIYALACMTYELLSGKHPFGRLSAEKAQEVNLQVKPIAQLSRRQWRGLQKGLAFTQDKRSATVEAFINHLKPRSLAYYAYWAGAIALAGLLSLNIYWQVQYQSGDKFITNHVELSAEQQKQIDSLLELAEIHLDVGYLTAPTGSNAFWAYQEVLKIDPYNQAALKGIEKIANMIQQQAIAFYEQGNRSEALKKVMEGLEVSPAHKGLLALRDQYEGN